MAGKTRPTARKIFLGQELRRLRLLVRPALTIEEAAAGCPFSEAMLQRAETGISALRQAGHLRTLLERYGVTDEDTIAELLEIQREAASEEWVEEYTDSMTPSLMTKFVAIEEAALTIRAYHPLLPWGSLQTERYARALFGMQQPVLEVPTESVDRAVRLRMRRAEFFTREDPVQLLAVIGEPALRHIVGGIDVMQEQCEALIKLSELEHVSIQILPSHGTRYRFASDFSILDLGAPLPQQVQADTAWGAVSMTGKARMVGIFTRRFERLSASALPPEESADFIRKLAREIT